MEAGFRRVHSVPQGLEGELDDTRHRPHKSVVRRDGRHARLHRRLRAAMRPPGRE
jgi:hypothetical protein